MKRLKRWWNKGDGGEWYEPYITNGDVVTILLSSITIFLLIFFICIYFY